MRLITPASTSTTLTTQSQAVAPTTTSSIAPSKLRDCFENNKPALIKAALFTVFAGGSAASLAAGVINFKMKDTDDFGNPGPDFGAPQILGLGLMVLGVALGTGALGGVAVGIKQAITKRSSGDQSELEMGALV